MALADAIADGAAAKPPNGIVGSTTRGEEAAKCD